MALLEAEKLPSGTAEEAADSECGNDTDPVTSLLQELDGQILASVYCHARHGLFKDAMRKYADDIRLLLVDGALNPACIADIEAEVHRRAKHGRQKRKYKSNGGRSQRSVVPAVRYGETTQGTAAEAPASSVKHLGRRPGTLDMHQLKMRGKAGVTEAVMLEMAEPHRSIFGEYLRGVPFNSMRDHFHLSPSQLNKAIIVARQHCDAILNQGAGI